MLCAARTISRCEVEERLYFLYFCGHCHDAVWWKVGRISETNGRCLVGMAGNGLLLGGKVGYGFGNFVFNSLGSFEEF